MLNIDAVLKFSWIFYKNYDSVYLRILERTVMYIWILLATIMIALSFFNLSPRADKESVFTETKAASLVNRFRIEHSAFSRVAECKMVNSISTSDKMIKFPANEQDAYIWENKALPIGYTPSTSLNSSHYIFCLDNELTNGGSPQFADSCVSETNLVFRYSVSFAPLPERWYLKEEQEDGEGEAGIVMPILSNAMSKLFVKGSVLGILSCNEEDECSFRGSNAYEKKLNQGNRKLTGLSFKKGEEVSENPDFYTTLFANTDFINSCLGVCLFAVHKLSNKDVDNHCKTLYENDYKLPEEDEEDNSEVPNNEQGE